jgi:hypothetical protein
MGDPPEKPRNAKTLKGYGPPDEALTASGELPLDADDRDIPTLVDPPKKSAPKKRGGGTPLVEIEVIHEHGPAPHTDKPWRTLEVWTRNRIYTLDPSLNCVEVRDRASREVVEDHPFIGLRLVGGQHREGESIELSYPFPRPGTEAVFERPGAKHGQFSRTSAVTRVVLRLHIVTVAPNHVVPTWEEITGSFPNFVVPTE